MATLMHAPRTGEQIRLIIELRWRMFRNGLRESSAKLHAAVAILLSLLWAALAMGPGIAFVFGGHLLVRHNQTQWLLLLLWGISLFWQLFPIFAMQSTPDLDTHSLLRFPVRFSAFFLLSLAYGLAGPAELTGIFWHACLGVGIVSARPDLIGWTALVLGISVLMNLLFSRMTYSWLDRIMAKRRVREILFVIVMLCAVSVQFTMRRWHEEILRFFQRGSLIWSALPPGRAAAALVSFIGGRIGDALAATAILALYAAVFGGLFAYRLRAQYLGEDLGESPAPAARKVKVKRPAVQAKTAAPAAATDRPGLVAGPVAAVFMKEIRYFYRNTILLWQFGFPLIFVVFICLTRVGANGSLSAGRIFSLGQWLYPAAAGYIFLGLMQICPNSLAFDQAGVQLFFTAPVKFRDVMLGKNLFHALTIAVEVLLLWGIVTVFGLPPRVPILLATWTGMGFCLLIYFTINNWLSLKYPRRFEFGVRRQRISQLSMLISLGALLAILAVIAAVVAIVGWLADIWFVPVALAAMSAAALAVYRTGIKATTRQAMEEREAILKELAR
jgi:ABC-2 type transport system permease protein